MSPARRLVLRSGREIPLIPRYFDLLVLLIRRREQAVARREILDAVWVDVVVSDGSLSQAVRIVRRALGDDPRAPVYIKTVSRHGYRFVHPEVLEEPDLADPAGAAPPANDAFRAEPQAERVDPFRAPLDVLLARAPAARTAPDDDPRRDAAETLHALGTGEALRRLDEHREHPAYSAARAWLRETRWDVRGAGQVPLLDHPGGIAALRQLVALRATRAWRLARSRWASAIAGGAIAGATSGWLGGLVLRFGPDSSASGRVLLALPIVGAVIGGLGAAGVGAGLAAAEVTVRSFRRTALVLLGSVGGGVVGAGAHLVGMAVLEGLFGRDLSPLGGGVEGVVLGGAVGLGYALTTPTADGGMATPHAGARATVVLATGIVCALAGAALGGSGRYLGAMSLDFLAGRFPGSQVGLEPLSRLLGEAAAGPRTTVAISAFEGLMFGAGVALGITRRPR